MTPLQIAVSIGTIISLAVSGWNAWSRVKTDLAIALLRADFAEKLSKHVIEQAETFAALRLDLERHFVSKESLDKVIENFAKLLNKLGGQVREFERLMDKRFGEVRTGDHAGE